MRTSFAFLTAVILTAGGTHMLVFPNLILIGVQIRVVQPVSPAILETLIGGRPSRFTEADRTGYAAAEIRAQDPRKTVIAYVRNRGGEIQVVGIDRAW